MITKIPKSLIKFIFRESVSSSDSVDTRSECRIFVLLGCSILYAEVVLCSLRVNYSVVVVVVVVTFKTL